MKFTLKQVFSIVDGRLSNKISDVYEILSCATGKKLYTHDLPDAHDLVLKVNPIWFNESKVIIDEIKSKVGNDFETLMKYINKHHNKTLIEVTKI